MRVYKEIEEACPLQLLILVGLQTKGLKLLLKVSCISCVHLIILTFVQDITPANESRKEHIGLTCQKIYFFVQIRDDNPHLSISTASRPSGLGSSIVLVLDAYQLGDQSHGDKQRSGLCENKIQSTFDFIFSRSSLTTSHVDSYHTKQIWLANFCKTLLKRSGLSTLTKTGESKPRLKHFTQALTCINVT